MSVLVHMGNDDQLSAMGLVSAECLARHILRIHKAVRRAPRGPDFKGLNLSAASRLDSGGTILGGEFARRTAEEQKT